MNLMVLQSFSSQIHIEWWAISALFFHSFFLCLMFLSLDFIRLCSSTLQPSFVYFVVRSVHSYCFACWYASLMLLMRFVQFIFFSTFKEVWIVLLLKWKLSTMICKIGLFVLFLFQCLFPFFHPFPLLFGPACFAFEFSLHCTQATTQSDTIPTAFSIQFVTVWELTNGGTAIEKGNLFLFHFVKYFDVLFCRSFFNSSIVKFFS